MKTNVMEASGNQTNVRTANGRYESAGRRPKLEFRFLKPVTLGSPNRATSALAIPAGLTYGFIHPVSLWPDHGVRPLATKSKVEFGFIHPISY